MSTQPEALRLAALLEALKAVELRSRASCEDYAQHKQRQDQRVLELAERVLELKAQRDALLEALRKIGRYTGDGPTYTTPWRDIVADLGQTARAAIALCEGPVAAVEETK